MEIKFITEGMGLQQMRGQSNRAPLLDARRLLGRRHRF